MSAAAICWPSSWSKPERDGVGDAGAAACRQRRAFEYLSGRNAALAVILAANKYLTRQQSDCAFDGFCSKGPSAIRRVETCLVVSPVQTARNQCLDDIPTLDRFQHRQLLKSISRASLTALDLMIGHVT